jgi:hypothetical protein
MDMTGQGRVKRAHHQLPMFIELIIGKTYMRAGFPTRG